MEAVVAKRSFVLHFQPIVSLLDGSVRHHEALLRVSGGGGKPLLSPEPFLRAAERWGLAPALDRAVLDMAVAKAAEVGSGTVAVNLSALSLEDPSLPAYIAGRLAASGLPGRRLVVEITETAAIADLDLAAGCLAEVRSLGVRVAFDDFGVGCNSLQYLTTLPFDMVKIDGMFVRRMRVSATDRLVVEAVTSLAKGLGKQTVAEYVADSETVCMLRSLGVDHAQGFALGRPRPFLAV